jgi:phage terminase large subunit-like protein
MTATLGARFEPGTRRLVMEFPADFPWRARLAPMLERGDDGRLLIETSREWRIRITERDPLLFALIYLRKHVTVKRWDAERGEFYDLASFSEWHLDFVTFLRTMLGGRPQRRAFVVPRKGAKTTWIAAPIAPIWAIAHRHRRFVLLFGNNSEQATMHLATIRQELAENEILLADFEHLAPVRLPGSRDSLRTVLRGGATIAARGMESQALGIKSGADRPDFIVLDDVSPDGANNSAAKVAKRITTLVEAILPMNEEATVVFGGTTTLYDDPAHQLVMHALGERTAPWIAETHFEADYYPAILDEGTAAERSLWPAMWSLSWLLRQAYPTGDRRRMARSFAMNYQNRPELVGGSRWTHDTFVIDPRFTAAEFVMTVDTAVTTLDTSDESAICIASIDAAGRQVCIEHVWSGRVTGTELREMIWRLKASNPRLRRVYVERNQGGDLWRRILSPLPVGLELVLSRPDRRGSKRERIEWLLDQYLRLAIVHRSKHGKAQDQMIAWPRVTHDDMIDVIEAAVACLLGLPMGES